LQAPKLTPPATPNYVPYDPSKIGSGTGRSTGQYQLNVNLNPPITGGETPLPAGTTGPKISLKTTSATYASEANKEVVIAQGLVESTANSEGVNNGASVLTIALTTQDAIPTGGVDVVVNASGALKDYLRNLHSRPFAIGGQVTGPVLGANGEVSGIKFKMTEKNAQFNLLILNDGIANSPRELTFSLGGGSYVPDSTANSSTVKIYDNLAQVPVAANSPKVSIEINTPTLFESTENAATLSLKLDSAPPAEGLVVYVDTGVSQSLGQFDLFNADITGGVFPTANFVAGGFYFKMTEQTASISLKTFFDGDTEGLTGYNFRIIPGIGYQVDATKGAASLSIADSPSVTKPWLSYTATPGSATAPGTLAESAGTVSVHTFTLSVEPPAGGTLVTVTADKLSDFDLTKAEITGATLVGATANEFTFNQTARSAIVRVPIKADGIPEAAEAATFSIAPSAFYEVNPASNKVTFNLTDVAAGFPAEAEGADLKGINDTIAQAVDTKLGGATTKFTTSARLGNAAPNFIDSAEDVDMYKFDLKKGDKVTIDIDSLSFKSTDTTITVDQFVANEIRIFDATGKQLAIATSGAAADELFNSNRDSYIEFTATADGAYYAGVAANSNRYYDPNVAGSGGGRIIPASGINIGAYDLSATLTPYQKPEVGFSVSPTKLDEEKGGTLVFTFNTTGSIPKEGLVVELKGNAANILTQFTAAQLRFAADGKPFYRFDRNLKVTGGNLTDNDINPADLSSFKFRIYDAKATIEMPLVNDTVEEKDATYTYTLSAGEGYAIDSKAASASFSLTDGVAGGVGPTVSLTATPSDLYESEATAVTLTLKVAGTIPADGILVYVDSGVPRALSEFDINAANPRTPENNFTVEGLVTKGGTVAGTDNAAGGFFFRIKEPTATITVPVFKDGETEGKESYTFKVIDGEKYQVNAAQNSATINIFDERSAAPTPTPTGEPVLSISASTTNLNEAEKTPVTFTFKATGDFPKDGIIFKTTAGFLPNPQLDLTGFSFGNPEVINGLEFFDFTEPAPGVFEIAWKMTKPEAFIKTGVFDDTIAEAPAKVTAGILPGTGYKVDSAQGSVTLNVIDGVPGIGGPKVNFSVDKTELTEGDRLTITFNVDGTVPADGLQVHVGSDLFGSLSEFALFENNERFGTPLFTYTGLKADPEADSNAGGFSVVMAGNTATLSIDVADDDLKEGTETLTFKLLDGELYDVAATQKDIPIKITDKPSISGGAGDDMLYGNVTTFYGGAGNDSIFGNGVASKQFGEDGNDKLYGSHIDDKLDGGAGNDILYGNGSNDMLVGGAGDDLIYGGSGIDKVDGGTGNDTVWLNGGKDVVTLRKGDGVDTINGFQVGQTQFSLDGLQFSDLTFKQGSDFTEILTGTEVLAKVSYVNATSLNAASNFTAV
jgi:Bacterial pre-peptidase C-terminal domain/RTX calcium-binding nonapeptide repeat (4 copies)